MSEQYPAWLDKNKTILSKGEFTKYEQQFKITKKICIEFEKESSNSEEAKSETFNNVLALMEVGFTDTIS